MKQYSRCPRDVGNRDLQPRSRSRRPREESMGRRRQGGARRASDKQSGTKHTPLASFLTPHTSYPRYLLIFPFPLPLPSTTCILTHFLSNPTAHLTRITPPQIKRLLASKKARGSATQCFEALPLDDRPTELVNSILTKYKSLILYMRDELQNNTPNNSNNKSEGDGHHLRRVFGKASKGAKWVIKEEWVQGRIDEIKELEKMIQE